MEAEGTHHMLSAARDPGKRPRTVAFKVATQAQMRELRTRGLQLSESDNLEL